MPTKKIGEGAQARYNEKRPTVAFRAPSVEWKEQLQQAADKAGQSVGEYVIQAVQSYMDGPSKPKQTKVPKEQKEQIEALSDPDVLKAFKGL